MDAESQTQETHAAIANRLREWLSMSDAEMRLQCGELSAQDIRNIRAILSEIYRRHE